MHEQYVRVITPEPAPTEETEEARPCVCSLWAVLQPWAALGPQLELPAAAEARHGAAHACLRACMAGCTLEIAAFHVLQACCLLRRSSAVLCSTALPSRTEPCPAHCRSATCCGRAWTCATSGCSAPR